MQLFVQSEILECCESCYAELKKIERESLLNYEKAVILVRRVQAKCETEDTTEESAANDDDQTDKSFTEVGDLLISRPWYRLFTIPNLITAKSRIAVRSKEVQESLQRFGRADVHRRRLQEAAKKHPASKVSRRERVRRLLKPDAVAAEDPG